MTECDIRSHVDPNSPEWQEPRPALFVHDGTAYVSDPAGNAVHAVDLATGEVTATGELDHTPNELTGVTG